MRCQLDAVLLPVAGRLLKYLLPSFFEQQQCSVCLIQQVSDMDPQVLSLIFLGRLAICRPGASVGVPNLHELHCSLRYQLWQVRRTVPQAKPGVTAQLLELIKSSEGLVH